MSSRFLFFSIAFFALLNPAISQTLLDNLSWKTGNEAFLKQNSVEVIADFVNDKLPDKKWFDISPKYIKDYQWIDLNSDGNLELLICYIESRFRADLFIFTSLDEKKTFLQAIEGWDFEKVDTAIKDLENDGNYEIVLQQGLTPFRGGAHPIAFWTAIYRWNQGRLMRADSDYLAFYRDLLPLIESEFQRIKELRDCDEDSPGKMDLELTSCLVTARLLAVKIIERDRIHRHVGVDPRAGFREALTWSKYADSVMRENAVIVFKDIADKKSLEQLEILSNDPESNVSSMARRAIEDLMKTQTE